jgi:hypothetical protein
MISQDSLATHGATDDGWILLRERNPWFEKTMDDDGLREIQEELQGAHPGDCVGLSFGQLARANQLRNGELDLSSATPDVFAFIVSHESLCVRGILKKARDFGCLWSTVHDIPNRNTLIPASKTCFIE